MIPDGASDAFHQLANGRRIIDNIDIEVGIEASVWDGY